MTQATLVNPKREYLFWLMVAKGSCWMWTGAVAVDTGYGVVNYEGRTEYVHRLSFMIKHHRRPVGKVAHTCQNKLCVRPDHLVEKPPVQL